jgi:hypothetical protein
VLSVSDPASTPFVGDYRRDSSQISKKIEMRSHQIAKNT